MKDYQEIIGKTILAISIIIAGIIIAAAIQNAGTNIGGMIANALETLN
ncbi:hypothetical protein EDD66_101412 [Mobilisporobacter senegalensis]|uniref:Uncharacterized protein n=1 Tax=Mobilisporobacter senegalensis TaxID=1329262 RepID=A0A3N1XYY4_9FIRM|nr:hypothetical protein [Mobilisporobacter senegalensis]ROR31794.1 hypothetical protein EDD66_101412 [Mobilisporobacter senegalensis]